MNSLDEAWLWYETVRTQLHIIGLLGRRYWESLPWDGPLGREEKFKGVEGTTLNYRSSFSLEHLDDLAVLVLFSVFESVVRETVLAEVRLERKKLVHSQVIRIVDDALDGIENGSFGRLMEAFKGQDAGLVEEVNQVRRYRNWVAHGKRSARPFSVDPRTAFDRLDRFLDGLAGIDSPT